VRQYSAEIGFDSYREIEVMSGKTICLMSYYGNGPQKQSILLNSHTDVVPADQVIQNLDLLSIMFSLFSIKMSRNSGNAMLLKVNATKMAIFTVEAFKT
jgi:hypothetical protein